MPNDIGRASELLAGAGIEQPRFEAQLLLAHVMQVSRAAVVANIAGAPTACQRTRFGELVAQRARHVPFAYLRGAQEFYGLSFLVSPAVLIPRPETELLVDYALEGSESGLFADVGTGSGCIGVSITVNAPRMQGIAIDTSADALSVASRNAAHNGVEGRVRFVRASLLEAVATQTLDAVVSNPPYIPTDEIAGLMPEVRDHEPLCALDGGADGSIYVRRLACDAIRCLKPGGRFAVEIGQGQAPSTVAIFGDAGFRDVTVRKDLAGIERVVCGKRR